MAPMILYNKAASMTILTHMIQYIKGALPLVPMIQYIEGAYGAYNSIHQGAPDTYDSKRWRAPLAHIIQYIKGTPGVYNSIY